MRLDKREHKSDAFLAINPMGKLPVIVHRGVTVTEAAAICVYLADAFPAAGLAPALDDPSRGTYLRWMFFGAGCVEPATADRMLGREPGDRASMVGYGSYDDTINALEGAVTPGPYILGTRFSAADVYLGSQIGFGLMTKTIEPRAAFTAYQGQLAERPAFKRFMQQTQTFMDQLKS